MGVKKKVRKFAQVKRAITLRDSRLYVYSLFFPLQTMQLTTTLQKTARREKTREKG